MNAAKLNFYCEQGATFLRRFELVDGDLTGYAVRGQVRDVTTGGKVVDLTCSTITVATEGTGDDEVTVSSFTVSLTAVQTAALTISRGYRYSDTTRYTYDIELFSGDVVVRLVNGDFSVSPEATK